MVPDEDCISDVQGVWSVTAIHPSSIRELMLVDILESDVSVLVVWSLNVFLVEEIVVISGESQLVSQQGFGRSIAGGRVFSGPKVPQDYW